MKSQTGKAIMDIKHNLNQNNARRNVGRGRSTHQRIRKGSRNSRDSSPAISRVESRMASLMGEMQKLKLGLASGHLNTKPHETQIPLAKANNFGNYSSSENIPSLTEWDVNTNKTIVDVYTALGQRIVASEKGLQSPEDEGKMAEMLYSRLANKDKNPIGPMSMKAAPPIKHSEVKAEYENMFQKEKNSSLSLNDQEAEQNMSGLPADETSVLNAIKILLSNTGKSEKPPKVEETKSPGTQPPSANPSVCPVEERMKKLILDDYIVNGQHGSKLRMLKDIGLTKDPANVIKLLEEKNGDLNAVIAFLSQIA